ncbi:ATP-binding protein [Promicromonospora thailandica]|uniref:Bacterial condensin subunit MukB n=1 Tax=Promicromonospora thailandica TaxID=765201 RepID=A0A9X2JXU9_9MICO|nr:SbcC/MukB-like Walker B domain-containing protein [Promicromonospora thailandica]MCP2266583.1 bacterial condensin subunit MukB [Promicromonospora thailandica]BFF17342.1 ATP-binding protein [Promicromonospora thailandica]
MTMIDTLFGMIPAASTGRQWVARDLQLVNWGGYDGYHRVRLAPTATLLSGGSGSGKSTLMDAYIALLMPHTTPFNGASNGSVVGRPRGKDQRNILSYARGKIDESRTDDGTRQRVLRGDGRDTWSAIAMTWADQAGAEFTAVRAWYVPAAARTLEEVVALRATCDGPFDLRDLESAAARRLARPAVVDAGLTPFDTDRELTARLHSTLGIGASGDGNKAVALLGRIQAGQQITTVDALYKAMVLEEPDTLATADEVVEHFDELAGTREQMITARQQVNALSGIRAHHAALGGAVERLRVIERVGSFADAASPAALWRHERRLDLLRAVERDVQAGHRDALARAEETRARIAAAKSELDGAQETLRASGGDRLATAQRELKGVDARLAEVGRARGRLDTALGVLGVPAATEAEFAAVAARARAATADAGAKRAARDAFGDAMSVRNTARADLAELEAERSAAAARRGNIPDHLHRARAVLAEAAGLTPEDLPFVGELLEVRTEFEPWRGAFNLALGGFATKMLIDTAHVQAFRKAIDGVPTTTRVRFEGVPTGMRDDVGVDSRTLPGRLDVRGGPFAGWLRHELAQRFAYVCVDTPGQLGQHKMALTRAGQQSEGRRGAHGGSLRSNVLGFTNGLVLADLDDRIARARQRLAEVEQRVADAEARLNRHDDELEAYRTVSALTWDQVDVAAVEAERARWADVIQEVTAGNPEITHLREQSARLGTLIDDLNQELGKTTAQAESLEERWTAVTDEVDEAQRALDDAEAAEVAVGPDERTYLDALFGTADPPQAHDPEAAAAALAAFDGALRQAAERLKADREAARAALDGSREALRRTFETFKERWQDPNLGTDPDESFADYDRILTDLEANGLHELEAEWRNSLLRLSGNDLADLHSALAGAVREIKERIGPVNEILADLPFADDGHRLRIDARDNQSAVVGAFRKELRALRETLGQEATDAERERRYLRTARLVDRIRRTAPDFADLVDVRRHVRLSAEKVDLDGNHVAHYDGIGEKSGGESQELVAFIVGAALRYQLGDAGAERPRYAPVFLDEALIKADARFTGRAVGAWRGLGFQLVIGAPNDKYSALEPHVDLKYVVLKDDSGRSRTKAVAGVADRP